MRALRCSTRLTSWRLSSCLQRSAQWKMAGTSLGRHAAEREQPIEPFSQPDAEELLICQVPRNSVLVAQSRAGIYGH